jgi:hypothetical protein
MVPAAEIPVELCEITVDIYALAVLPIEYQATQQELFAQICKDREIDTAYRDVFTAGIRGYQLATYLMLLRRYFGEQVADQVWTCQRRLLGRDTVGTPAARAMDLISHALGGKEVAATTETGSVDIPIEMNVALALLLGMPESPDFVARPEQRIGQINRMRLDIDWDLSHCLFRAYEEIVKIFAPLLSCVAAIREAGSGEE